MGGDERLSAWQAGAAVDPMPHGYLCVFTCFSHSVYGSVLLPLLLSPASLRPQGCITFKPCHALRFTRRAIDNGHVLRALMPTSC